jgi:xylulokinase
MTSRGTRYVLGADIGTSSCKTILTDDVRRVIASDSESYPCIYPKPGFVEQDPEAWYQAFCRTTNRVIQEANANPSAIQAICIVGVTHNPVLLDADEKVLRNAIHFWDKRSVEQVGQITKKWGDEVRVRTLNEPDPLWSWPQLLWIRDNEHDIWDSIVHLLFPKDYVRHRLVPSLFTDAVDPVGTLLYDPRRLEWVQSFVDDLGLPYSSLPEARPPESIAGGLSPKAAAETGLTAGTPVLTGTTDTAAELLGAGAVKSGQAVVKLASVGRIMIVRDKPLDHPTILNYPHVIPGLWYPGSVTKYGAGAYSWAREVFWNESEEDGIYRKMDDSASEVPLGCEGVLFHPHLAGEYAPQWDTKLRASFTGLSVQHTRAHFTRAVLEGVAFQIHSALAQVMEHGGIYHEVRLIGGGANSRVWAQIMANVLAVELLVPEHKSAAYGACMLAGKTVGMFQQESNTLTKMEKYTPDPETQALYEELYAAYQDLEPALAKISHQIEELRL